MGTTFVCIRRTEGTGCGGQLRKGSSRDEQDLWDEDKEVNPHLLAMGVDATNGSAWREPIPRNPEAKLG